MTLFRYILKLNYNLVYSHIAKLIINNSTIIIVPRFNPKLKYNLVNNHTIQLIRGKKEKSDKKKKGDCNNFPSTRKRIQCPY